MPHRQSVPHSFALRDIQDIPYREANSARTPLPAGTSWRRWWSYVLAGALAGVALGLVVPKPARQLNLPVVSTPSQVVASLGNTIRPEGATGHTTPTQIVGLAQTTPPHLPTPLMPTPLSSGSSPLNLTIERAANQVLEKTASNIDLSLEGEGSDEVAISHRPAQSANARTDDSENTVLLYRSTKLNHFRSAATMASNGRDGF